MMLEPGSPCWLRASSVKRRLGVKEKISSGDSREVGKEERAGRMRDGIMGVEVGAPWLGWGRVLDGCYCVLAGF